MTRHMRGLLPQSQRTMGDIVTMDDLTNQEIVAVLDDAERLVPVARGDVYLPPTGKGAGKHVLRKLN